MRRHINILCKIYILLYYILSVYKYNHQIEKNIKYIIYKK